MDGAVEGDEADVSALGVGQVIERLLHSLGECLEHAGRDRIVGDIDHEKVGGRHRPSAAEKRELRKKKKKKLRCERKTQRVGGGQGEFSSPDHVLRRSDKLYAALGELRSFGPVLAAAIAIELAEVVVGCFVDQIAQVAPPAPAAFQEVHEGVDVGAALPAPDDARTPKIDHRYFVLRVCRVCGLSKQACNAQEATH